MAALSAAASITAAPASSSTLRRPHHISSQQQLLAELSTLDSFSRRPRNTGNGCCSSNASSSSSSQFLHLASATAAGGLLRQSLPRSYQSQQAHQSRRTACSAGTSNGSYGSHSFDDQEYIEAHVIDAVRMVPVREQLLMAMADGTQVEVEHVNPSAGRLLYLHSMPTIFLRILAQDTTNLLLPIVVGDLAMSFLLKGVRREANARPSYYELMQDMVESMRCEIKHVKITQRVGDTYYARIFLAKLDTTELVSVDARPSDAVNLAVRAKVPIFVSKTIVSSDAVRVVHDPAAKHPGIVQGRQPEDRSSARDDELTEEIALIRSMRTAAEEERYADAARLRDQLNQLRSKSGRKQQLKF